MNRHIVGYSKIVTNLFIVKLYSNKNIIKTLIEKITAMTQYAPNYLKRLRLKLTIF